MPAEDKAPDRIEASQAGNGPLSPMRGMWPQTLTDGLTRSVQTKSHKCLQCTSREEFQDRVRSYPAPRPAKTAPSGDTGERR
jgi:hypothetical protein